MGLTLPLEKVCQGAEALPLWKWGPGVDGVNSPLEKGGLGAEALPLWKRGAGGIFTNDVKSHSFMQIPLVFPLLGNPPLIPPFRKGGWGWGWEVIH